MLDFLRSLFSLKRRSPDTTEPVGWASLAALIEDLERIGRMHEEIYDTDVREQLWKFLEARFIQLDRQLPVPTSFGMFSDEGNDKVHEAFARNAENLDTIVEIFALDTYEKRKVTFTNPRVRTAAGNHLEDFFGTP